MLWTVWNCRNKKRFKEVLPSEGLWEWVLSYLAVFREASRSSVTDSHSGMVCTNTRWKPPINEWHKVNVNAAFRVGQFMSRSGVIIRNARGEVMVAATKVHMNVRNSDMAEALAVIDGARVAIDAGLLPFELEFDSIRIFHLLQRQQEDRSEVGFLIDSLLTEVQLSDAISFNFTTLREGNRVVHELACKAVADFISDVWMESWLVCVDDLVVEEATLCIPS